MYPQFFNVHPGINTTISTIPAEDQPLGTLQVDECPEALLVRYAERDFFGPATHGEPPCGDWLDPIWVPKWRI